MVRAKAVPFLGSLLVMGSMLSSGHALAVDDPSGYWATEKHESQIKIAHCAPDTICGSVFWMRTPNDAKGNPKLDKENEDEAKRKNTLLGLQLISMQPDDDHWKGTVYNPLNGKTYSATLKLLSKNEVQIEGCVAYVLCGGQKWTREEPKLATTGAAPGVLVHTTAPKAGVAGAAVPKPASTEDPPADSSE